MLKKAVHIAKVTGIHGTEKHLLSLLPALNRYYEVVFILLTEPGNPLPEYVEMLEKQGVRVIGLPIRLDADPLCLWRIVRHIRALAPALVHTHLIHGDVYGIVSASLAGVRAIVTTKHNDDRFRRHFFFRGLNKYLNSKACRVIAISDWVRRFVGTAEGVPSEKVETIHYGLAAPAIGKSRETVRRELGFEGPEIVVGMIARLVKQKGHRYLIEAFSKAGRENENLRLVIAGEGELKDGLERAVKDRGLEGTVQFTGYRGDVPDLLGAFDVFAHPSLWEGFGLSILEAMAMEKPVIASRVSAIPELVEDGVTGVLVEPRDSDDLARALDRVARDADLRRRLGQSARRRWEAHFSLESMVEKTRRLYDEITVSANAC